MTREKVLLVQTAIGEYRRYFLEDLQRLLGDRVEVLTGLQSFHPSTELRLDCPMVRPEAVNVFLVGRRLLWQRGVLVPGVSAGLVVMEYNSRVLSTWSILLLRWILRRPSLLWGHARSRSRSTGGEAVRAVMRWFASALIVYTEAERAELARSTRRRVFAAPNGLYPRELMTATEREPADIIWTGRLVADKKPLLAVQGFRWALDRLPVDTRLLLVGAGPEQHAVELLIADLCLSDRVVVTGYISSPTRLADLYGSALLSLSTGYVGLSLVQSLAFGVPMLYARDEPHAPEIEAANGLNSGTFSSDDAADLGEMIIDMFAHRTLWSGRRVAIAAECRSRYSTEAMAESFATAILAVQR